MVDPISAVGTAVGVADKLQRWYENAQAAARTKEQQDAAALVYFAALLASAVAALDLEFQALTDRINGLDTDWSQERRDELAAAVRAVATKETRLNQLTTATAFLQESTHREPGWRDRILHRGGRDARLDEALDELLETGNNVLTLIGAGHLAATPHGVDDLVRLVKGANNLNAIEHTKAKAADILGVIDRLTARSVHDAFGRFASVVSRKHGIPSPDWASLQ
jgi:hypothetical protein